ncbi:MAG: hypothetical protein J6M39_00345 [Lachnospiraceae bacterium]|nr:hypothetical protein [Lachnospiraceae bacterium]
MLYLIIKLLLICLIITIVIEYIPIVIFLQISNNYFIAVNVLTNVVANVILLIYDILNIENNLLMDRWQIIIVLEIIICIVEIYLYCIYTDKKIINDKNISASSVNTIKKQMYAKVIFTTIFANVLSFTLGTILLKVAMRG